MTSKEKIRKLMEYGIRLRKIAQEADMGYSTLKRWLADEIEISKEKQMNLEYAIVNIGADIYSITNACDDDMGEGDDLEAILAEMRKNDE